MNIHSIELTDSADFYIDYSLFDFKIKFNSFIVGDLIFSFFCYVISYFNSNSKGIIFNSFDFSILDYLYLLELLFLIDCEDYFLFNL